MIETGSTPSTSVPEYWEGGSIRWITPFDLGKLKSPFISETSRRITQKGLENSSATLVPAGSVIISTRAPIGYLAVLKEPMAFNQGCKALLQKNGTPFEPLYVYYQLQTKIEEMNHLGSGSTFKEISKEKLQSIRVQLPPLPIQKQIAAILEKADAAREKRRKANQLTEQFLQSAFLEMFGDPVTNPKGWDRKELGSMSERFSDGPFGSNLKTEHYTDNGIRIIRLQNIGIGQLIDEDKTYISARHFATISKHKCIPGDVLIGTLGDPNLRACVLPTNIPIALNKADCIQMRPKKQVSDAHYVCWLLNQPATLTLAASMIHGQTRARINMGRLRGLPVPCPPLKLQRDFAGLVKKVQSMRARQKESEKELEELFQSLMQKAFKGELVS